jgi:hypothetical protein
MQWAYEQYKEDPSRSYTKHKGDIDETIREWIKEKKLDRNMKRQFKEFQKNSKDFDDYHWEEMDGAVDEWIEDKGACPCTPILVFATVTCWGQCGSE